MSNYYIQRPDFVKLGVQGALEAACTDLGSITSVEIPFEAEARMRRSSKYRGAPVEATIDAASATITVVCEEMTTELFQFLSGATYAANALAVDGTGGAPTYLTAYIGSIPIDGNKHTFHAVKCIVDPSFSLSLDAEGMEVELPLVMMVDPEASGAKFYELTLQSTDTTAPTIASVSPTDAATGVNVNSNFAWTFAEAVRSEDVTDKKFFVAKADGTMVAGALTIGTDNTVVTFNPTSDLAASTAHIAVAVKGIRDTAGNELAATSISNFTTA